MRSPISINLFKNFKCKIVGHDITDEDVRITMDKPYVVNKTSCQRCKFPVSLTADPEDRDYYLLTDYV